MACGCGQRKDAVTSNQLEAERQAAEAEAEAQRRADELAETVSK